MKQQDNLALWIDGKTDFPENENGRSIYEKIKKYSTQLEAPNFDKAKVYENIKSAQKIKSRSTLKLRTYVLRIAAVLILAVGLLVFLKQISLNSYQTAVAETQVLELPDHSQVLLQPGSSLSYNSYFWFIDREVILKGEAFFEVEKGKTFTVKTHHGKVTVLGTKFNIKSFADKLSVVCYEGRVQVEQNKISKIITSDEFIVVNDGKIENQSKTRLNDLPSVSEYYQILDLNFTELIKDVERYYDVQLDISRVKTNKNFTGQLPKRDINKALNIISETYQLQYKSFNKNNFIFVENESP